MEQEASCSKDKAFTPVKSVIPHSLCPLNTQSLSHCRGNYRKNKETMS